MENVGYALNAYTQSNVAAAADNPVDLIIMLYDGAVEFLNKAATAVNMKQLKIKIRYIDKSFAIIQELDNSLNYEAGGAVAANLHNLYFYMLRELVMANLHNDSAKLLHIAALLRELREGWVQIRDKV